MRQHRIIISSCSAPNLSLCRNVYCIFSREKIRKKIKEDMTTKLSTSATISIYTPISSTTSRLSSSVLIPRRLCSSDPKLNPARFSLRCNSSLGPGGPGPGENDSRSVLDAFFLGKALAEALNERIESTVGEFLSTIGRLQAEQQKQVQDFQEDVFERAKRAKEKAAREAMEAQGLVPKSSTANGPAVVDSDTTTNVPSATDATTTAIYPSSSNSSGPDINTDPGPNNKDSLLGASNED